VTIRTSNPQNAIPLSAKESLPEQVEEEELTIKQQQQQQW